MVVEDFNHHHTTVICHFSQKLPRLPLGIFCIDFVYYERESANVSFHVAFYVTFHYHLLFSLVGFRRYNYGGI